MSIYLLKGSLFGAETKGRFGGVIRASLISTLPNSLTYYLKFGWQMRQQFAFDICNSIALGATISLSIYNAFFNDLSRSASLWQLIQHDD